jgi:hypothetical protein
MILYNESELSLAVALRNWKWPKQSMNLLLQYVTPTFQDLATVLIVADRGVCCCNPKRLPESKHLLWRLLLALFVQFQQFCVIMLVLTALRL